MINVYKKLVFQIFNYLFIAPRELSADSKMKNYMVNYDTIHDFLAWLGTGSNSEDIDQFRSQSGIFFNSPSNVKSSKVL